MQRMTFVAWMLVASLALAACVAPAAPAEPAEPAEPAAAETAVPEEEMADEEMADEEAMDIVETAIAAGSFETLVTAVSEAGLVEALQGDGPFTVFAPTDEAFAALPEGTLETLLEDPAGDLNQILLYHVVPGAVMAADVSDGLEAETLQGSTVSFSIEGDSVMINEANIISTDIVASNGVIHVIDAVILPPAGDDMAEEEMADDEMADDEMAEATPAPEEEEMADEEAMDIVETAIAAGSFETLVTAVSEAGLVEALQGDGPFTVFAPTDEAFAALPEGTLETLLEDPAGDLQQILLYHVVPGAVMAADVSDGLEAETLQGSTVSFSIEGDSVMINEANIISTDIVASNGVIHVIDAVILPPAE